MSESADPASNPPIEPTPPASPPTSPGPAAPPPVAAIVVNGDKTERELQLEKDLAAERQAKKQVELDNAQMQDELHRMKTPPTPAPVNPPPRKRGPLGVRV